MGKERQDEPTLAPGDDQALETEATPSEIKRGDYTKVTQLSYDEVWNTEKKSGEGNDGD